MSILKSIFRKYMDQKIEKDLGAHDDFIQAKVSKIKGNPIFSNTKSNFYMKFVELNGYKSLACTISGFLEINTISHVYIELFAESDKSLLLKSESEIVEGMYSEITEVGITKFDIDIDNEVIEFVRNNRINKVSLRSKNGQVLKYDTAIDFDIINQKAFLEILNL
ncbi:MAG: hypothetical protein ABJG68_17175 [Crocinitomicaceae bacterium]